MAAPNEGAFGKLGTIGLAEVGMLGWFRPGVWPSAPLPWWVGAVPRTLPPSLSTMSSEALQRAQNVWPSRCPGNGVGWRSELLPCCGAGYLADKEVCACMLLECASRMCPGDRGPWPSVCVPLWSSVAWDRVTAPQLGSRAPPSDPRSPVPVRSMALLSLLSAQLGFRRCPSFLGSFMDWRGLCPLSLSLWALGTEPALRSFRGSRPGLAGGRCEGVEGQPARAGCGGPRAWGTAACQPKGRRGVTGARTLCGTSACWSLALGPPCLSVSLDEPPGHAHGCVFRSRLSPPAAGGLGAFL